jgi:hypothetical protein
MPNHCQNKLTLQNGGDILSVLTPYLTEATDDLYSFNFQKIIPMDEKLLEGEEWYAWRVANWGTKWEGYDGRFSEDCLAFTFDTAWAPPLPIIKKLAELTGEKFTLEYMELGMFFCGKYKAGQEGDYDEFHDNVENAPQELKDSLGYEPYEEEKFKS